MKPMPKHGVPHGPRAHRRRGEEPCVECVEAARVYQREWFHRHRPRRQPATRHRGPYPTPVPHGTAGGYAKHRRRGEVPCAECTAAHTAADVARRHAKGQPSRAAGDFTAISTTVLADLYLHAHPDAQQRAEQSTPDGVLQLAVTRYDQENP